MKLTKSKVDSLPYTASGQVVYRDTETPGFALIVGQTAKSYFVQKKIAGRRAYYTVGIHGQITVDEARKEAQRVLGEMTKGINPADAKREARAKAITLQEAFEDYLTARKNLKPRTIADYRDAMNYFSGWHGKPLAEINKDMIERKHRQLGDERGHARANCGMRVLRAIFNFAIDKYSDSKGHPIIHENPVRRLSQARAWYRIQGRTDYIRADELPALFRALDTLSGDTMRDYFLLMLFTGLRRQEAARLKWENVNLTAKMILIPDTKNNIPLELPLSTFLFGLLNRRKEIGGDGPFVFPGIGGTGHIKEPKRQLARLKKETGLFFTIHGLRRTFITIAEGLDLSQYAIKRLVNHKQGGGDITGQYVMRDVERLREPVQRIADYILAKAGKSEGGKVIPIARGVK